MHLNAFPGHALAVNHPSADQSLVLYTPGAGHHNLQFSYAAKHPDAGQAMHKVCYSPDSGLTWHTLADGLAIGEAYSVYTHDLSEYDGTGDNADLTLRLTFSDAGGGGLPGRVLLDNIVVKEAPLSLVAGIDPGRVSEDYAFQLEARYGEGPYHFEKVSGRLPHGLNLSPGGTVSGIPTEEGSFRFEVEVSDGRMAHAKQEYVLTVYPRSLIHYWHFNDLQAGVPDTVYADYSATGKKAFLYYHAAVRDTWTGRRTGRT